MMSPTLPARRAHGCAHGACSHCVTRSLHHNRTIVHCGSSAITGFPKRFATPGRHCTRNLSARYAAALYAGVPTSQDGHMLWNLMYLAGAALMAWYLANQREQAPSGEACPRCHGTGKEVCFCTRWSDGDKSGCSSCNHTGYTRCKACGGGGTAVPIALRIHIDETEAEGTKAGPLS